MATREELAELNVTQLRELAAEAEIEGRSNLNKEGLVDALADADGPAADDGPAPVRRPETAVAEGVRDAADATAEREPDPLEVETVDGREIRPSSRRSRRTPAAVPDRLRAIADATVKREEGLEVDTLRAGLPTTEDDNA